MRDEIVQTNGQITPIPANHGRLEVVVWPTYVGAGESNDGQVLTEPYGNADYERGQIWWETIEGDVRGHARVALPKGVYTHLMWCHGPCEQVIGVTALEQPLIFDRPGFFDVDPIRNQEYLPRG